MAATLRSRDPRLQTLKPLLEVKDRPHGTLHTAPTDVLLFALQYLVTFPFILQWVSKCLGAVSIGSLIARVGLPVLI